MSLVSHVMPNSCNTICTDSRGMNYCPVATVTPRMQKTPRRGLKNGDLWDLISKNHSSDRGAVVRSERVKKDWQGKNERKKRDSDTVRRKWGGKKKRGNRRRGLTSSNLQQCFRQFRSLLSLYSYKECRNTSSAIHFISIPTPASHLHSVSCTSPFHFSACHYISWMITYWQFLHWHRMGQDTTLPASKAGGKWAAFFQPCLFFLFLSSFLHPYSQSSSQVPPPSNSWSNPDLCFLTLTSPCRARWLPWDPRPDRMSRLSTATNEPGAQ